MGSMKQAYQYMYLYLQRLTDTDGLEGRCHQTSIFCWRPITPGTRTNQAVREWTTGRSEVAWAALGARQTGQHSYTSYPECLRRTRLMICIDVPSIIPAA